MKGLFEGDGKAVYQGGNTYEGQFRQGLMHGKGKYTWVKENVTYEGDFKDNEITGEGKYTWFDLRLLNFNGMIVFAFKNYGNKEKYLRFFQFK